MLSMPIWLIVFFSVFRLRLKMSQYDIKNQEEGNGAFFLTAFSDLAGTLTQDLRNRNPTLYTTKLRGLIVFRLLHAFLKVIYQLAE